MGTKKTNDPANRTRDSMTRGMCGDIVRKEGEADERTFTLSFSSEEPCERWFGLEILRHAAGAVDLSRLNEIGTLLFNHDTNRPIGRVISAELDEAARRCVAVVRFDEDAESETIFQKVKGGSLKGVSVRYRVDVWEEVAEGKTATDGIHKGPCSIAAKWEPLEISIVSVPADPTVGVGRSDNPEKPGGMEDENMGDKEKNKEGIKDAINTQPTQEVRSEETATATAPAETTVPAADEAERGMMAERARITEISAMCRNFDMDATDFIKSGASVEAARAAIMERLAASHKPVSVTVTADEGDKFRAAAMDGLAIRAGVSVEKPADGAENYRGKSLMRLAAECLEREGVGGVHDMQDEDLLRAAMTGSGAFPGILSNVAHKSMAAAYQTAPTTFQLWTASGSNADFKEATRYRLSEADELVKMTESGEFEHAEVTEASAKTAVATYGRSFSITRKAIINDDLGALSRIPALYGVAARRGINKLVYEILTSNPTIEGADLFHNNHKNLTTGAINVANLGKAKALMARQKNIGGKEALNIQPAFLIVPPELEVTAAQLISSVVDPTKANATPNPFANKLTVVADPELADADAWYLAAAPGLLPSIEVTYLNGKEQPTMESAVQFDTLGIKWRIYHDVGVNLIDFRGLLKSTGK